MSMRRCSTAPTSAPWWRSTPRSSAWRWVEADPKLMAVLRLGGGGVLLLFDPAAAGAPGRFVPSHGTTGAGHLAFGVADLDAWRRHLGSHDVEIEREIDWGSERASIYVRDPAGNSVEFARGELWG